MTVAAGNRKSRVRMVARTPVCWNADVGERTKRA